MYVLFNLGESLRLLVWKANRQGAEGLENLPPIFYGGVHMSMATLQLYKNPYIYPDYGTITSYGSSMACTPVGTGLKSGMIKVKGTMADFMNCNYLALTRSGKTIYAWIEDVKHSTANSFEVSYRLDPWRTFRSNITLGTQFIERSNIVTFKRDELLGSTQAEPDVLETMHTFDNSNNRTLVIQTTTDTGEQFSNTPVNPTQYKFYFMDYNIHDWVGNTSLNQFMMAIGGGAEPENIVTMYSVPFVDTSHLDTADITIHPGNTKVTGFKVLRENKTMQNRLTQQKKINIGTPINALMRVEHNVQLVIPDAGIISIPDYMLKDGDLYLRQDIDLFSGASNYMVVSSNKYYTQSVRGSSIASIPVISDIKDTYLSQNQNALATSLIGDVAGIAGGVVAGGGAGSALAGLNGIINRYANISDMTGKTSNAPAFLGTALVASFNQSFWVVVTKQNVDNENHVHNNFGYPMNKVMPLNFPTSGYIKTQACSVSSDGTVPRWAIEEINQMFNNGVLVK